MSFFAKKPDPREQARAQKREMQRHEREIQREVNASQRQERQLEADIKRAAKAGDNAQAKMLAKQLVQLRGARTRQLKAKGQISSARNTMSIMQTHAATAKAMGTAAKTMGTMNAQLKPEELAATMQQFEQESMRMDMAQSTMDDALDAAFDDSDVEEESSELVNAVLDEIGLGVGAQLAAPVRQRPAATFEAEDVGEDDLMRRLAALKAPST